MLFKEPVVQTRAGAQTLRGSEKQVAMSGHPPAQAVGGCQRLNSVVPGRDCIVYGRRDTLQVTPKETGEYLLVRGSKTGCPQDCYSRKWRAAHRGCHNRQGGSY